MTATIIVSVVTFVILTTSVLFYPTLKIGKIKIGLYWVIALCGALMLIGLESAPISAVWGNLSKNSPINPLKILLLFFSMTFLSIYLDEAGFFRYLAVKAANFANHGQFSLFITLYFLTAVLTVFTSNDVVILTLTPFVCFFCKKTKINPIPYLVGEFAAANTWSMTFVIGNPTNIYLATAAGIGFGEYFKVMALPTLAAGIAQFMIISALFNKQLKKPLEKEDEEEEKLKKPEFIIGIIHLSVCLIFLVISDYVNVEMWLVSAICAGSLLVVSLVKELFVKKDRGTLLSSAKRLPWQLIPFVLSMFVIVVAYKEQGVSAKIGEFLSKGDPIWTYGFASFVSSNLINNIPMSMLFSTLTESLTGAAYVKGVYASIVGSNIGAFLTPIGALAGIMFTELTERYEVKYGFGKFVLYGVIVSIPTIAVALGVLVITVG